jgi:hypothetical protein
MQTATTYTKKQEYYMRRILLTMIGLSVALLADFSRDSDGVVTDSVTGLQWQDNYSDNGDNIKSAKWTDAIAYCEALSLGGDDDWRLPNFNELYYLADRSKRNPAIDPPFQHTTTSSGYWSATTIVGDEDYAWGVFFYYGDDGWVDKDDSLYVRCVRARQ